ncbi:hypothetical protein NQZ68_000609 [Dissostichus eleginoides]|nr:hypothetical protein NQZ68_000609 [Dissostichus eleginoides]
MLHTIPPRPGAHRSRAHRGRGEDTRADRNNQPIQRFRYRLSSSRERGRDGERVYTVTLRRYLAKRRKAKQNEKSGEMDVEEDRESPFDDEASDSTDEDNEDGPGQESFKDEEVALPPDFEWLEELYKKDDGDGDLAVAAVSGEKRSCAETARMFKLRRNLDQLDCFHRQKEHDVQKARLRKERATTKQPKPFTTTFPCPHCTRIIGSRIGLYAHLKTHKDQEGGQSYSTTSDRR